MIESQKTDNTVTESDQVAVNESGRVIGQSHPKAKLTDGEVEIMRSLREQHGWSLKRLSQAFQCGLRTAADICSYQTRAQHADRHLPPRRAGRLAAGVADESAGSGDNATHEQTTSNTERD